MTVNYLNVKQKKKNDYSICNGLSNGMELGVTTIFFSVREEQNRFHRP